MSIKALATATPLELAEAVLSAAGGEVAVLVEDSSEVEVRFANNTVTSDGRRRLRRVSVVRYVPLEGGTAAGAASATGEVDPDALLRAAHADAIASGPAEDAAELPEGGADDDVGEAARAAEPGELATALSELGGVLERARGEGRVAAGFLEHSLVTTTLVTSAGTRRRHVQPTAKAQLAVRDPATGGTAWAGRSGRALAEGTLVGLDDSVRTRLAWASRRVELPAGRYRTVLPPDAVADLVPLVAEAASGRDAEEGHNVFSAPGGGTRLGERLFDLPFELRSDPAEPGLEAIPFVATSASSGDVSVFDNGAAIGRTVWIEGGTLSRLMWTRARAARAGVEPAFPPDNVVLELPGATATTDDLVAGVDRGLLLTCLWYIREVDPTTLLLTGLTRDGVFLIEAGEIIGAVNNFRFNESPVDLLRRASAVGRSEPALSREWNEWFPRTAMPPLLIEDFNCSSVSPAT